MMYPQMLLILLYVTYYAPIRFAPSLCYLLSLMSHIIACASHELPLNFCWTSNVLLLTFLTLEKLFRLLDDILHLFGTILPLSGTLLALLWHFIGTYPFC